MNRIGPPNGEILSKSNNRAKEETEIEGIWLMHKSWSVDGLSVGGPVDPGRLVSRRTPLEGLLAVLGTMVATMKKRLPMNNTEEERGAGGRMAALKKGLFLPVDL